MPCDPSDNNLSPTLGPPLPIPGLGIPQVSINLPIPGFEFPPFPEILDDLIELLRTRFPSGDFLPQIDNFANDLLKLLSNVLSQIAPFLSLYNFFTSLLNMILCIIEVLCAIPNPYSLFKAIKKLFKRCFPPFIRLFPWFALIAMIIALLLLLLALIEYIVQRILAIIEDLLANLRLLGDNTLLNDTDAVAAVAIKIASLLCIFENIFAVFTALGTIVAIIQSLAGIGGRSTCGSLRSGSGVTIEGDDVGCCPDSLCPPFIVEKQDGFVGVKGQFIYYNRLIPLPAPLDFPFPTLNTKLELRPERWQFINKEENQLLPQNDPIDNKNYMFKSIITAIDGGDVFWPEGISYNENTTLRKAPYYGNLTMRNLDPKPFFPSDDGGARTFIFKNVIVDIQPYVGTYNNRNIKDTNIDDGYGTLSLIGGQTYEVQNVIIDGYNTGETIEVPYRLSNNDIATIRDFFHIDDETVSELPSIITPDDGYYVSDVEFNIAINHESLVGYQLITLGCPPQIRIELDAVNAQFSDIRSVFDKLGGKIFPDLDSTLECTSNAIAKLRQDVSEDAVQEFKDEIVRCLSELREETLEIICNALFVSIDPFASIISIDPDIQFVTYPINVSVSLRDINGTDLSKNIPPDCLPGILDALKATVTLGTVSDFTYSSSSGTFIAEINSDIAGAGEISVEFNGNVFQKVINRDSDTESTSFEINSIPYEFIGSGDASKSAPRRNEIDIANG